MKWWKNNKKALEKIFEQYAGIMSLYARSFTGDIQTAEDIVQEIFIYLLKNDKIPDNPKSYLMQAVRNRAFNCQRIVKLRSLENTREIWFTHPIEKEEEREALTASLSALSQEQREVIVLKIWGNLTFKEIATTTGITANTAASRYRYALEHLRELMSKSYKEHYYE